MRNKILCTGLLAIFTIMLSSGFMVGCGTNMDICDAASEHLANCTGQEPQLVYCDQQAAAKAERVLNTSCDELNGALQRGTSCFFCGLFGWDDDDKGKDNDEPGKDNDEPGKDNDPPPPGDKDENEEDDPFYGIPGHPGNYDYGKSGGE